MISKEARIIIEPDGCKYHAYIPELTGLHTAGENVEDALLNIGEGLVAYMRSVIKHGDKVDLAGREEVVAEGVVTYEGGRRTRLLEAVKVGGKNLSDISLCLWELRGEVVRVTVEVIPGVDNGQ